MRLPIWFLLPFVLVHACKCNKTGNPPAATILPNTPTEVLAKWQEAQDGKDFNLARALSTERARKFIDNYDRLMNDPEMSDASVPKTVFQNLNCRMKNDSCAVCSFFTEEDGERLYDSLFILKTRGQWLVDLPDEEAGGDMMNDSLPDDLLFPNDL